MGLYLTVLACLTKSAVGLTDAWQRTKLIRAVLRQMDATHAVQPCLF